MKVGNPDLPELKFFEPAVFEDERGCFFESFNAAAFLRDTGIAAHFVQDNITRSKKNVLRGLHYQIAFPQGKLIRVSAGEIFDVAVDLRKQSAGFGKSLAIKLSAASGQSLWIPAGFAHGYLVLSESAEIHYKVTEYWNPSSERRIAWNDPDLKIDWPIQGPPILNKADATAPAFRNADKYA